MDFDTRRQSMGLAMIVLLSSALGWLYYMDLTKEDRRHKQGDRVPCLYTTRAVGIAEPLGEDNAEVRNTVIDAPGFECIPSLWAYKGRGFARDVAADTRLLPSMF